MPVFGFSRNKSIDVTKNVTKIYMLEICTSFPLSSSPFRLTSENPVFADTHAINFHLLGVVENDFVRIRVEYPLRLPR